MWRFPRLILALLPLLATVIARSASPPAIPPPDAADFGAFAERQFIDPLRERKIGGAVLVAVSEGRELYRVACGYRNVERRLPVDVDHTAFIIASVSKTFTATAIAQLKSRGSLDYEDLVASRLRSVKLTSRYAGQLRIRNLLTHTTGIPDLFLGASCRSSADCLPLAMFLGERQPEALAPPDTFVSYSNFSNALAGQIVADVSGQSYGDYLRERIFRPLGMLSTRYDVPGEPAADEPAAEQAAGYELDHAGKLVRSPANFSMFYPAGQIAASGADMGRYAIAQLDGGAFLADAERLDMQRVHATMPGFRDGYGWAWNSRHFGGVRVIGHGGDLRGVVTDLLLVPQGRFGYFAAITGDAGPVLEEFSRAFKERYLPKPHAKQSPVVAPGAAVPADLAGVYQDFRFSHDDPLQLLSMLSEARIRRTGTDSISVDLPEVVGGGTYRLAAVGRDEFRVVDAPPGRPVDEDARLRLIRDGKGEVRYFAFEDRGYDLVAAKMQLWRQTRFKIPALIAVLAGFLAATSMAAIALVRQRRAGVSNRLMTWAIMALAAACVAAFVFPVWMGVVLASASKWDLLYGLAALGLKPAYALLPAAGTALLAAAALAMAAPRGSARLGYTSATAILFGGAYLLLLALNGQFTKVY